MASTLSSNTHWIDFFSNNYTGNNSRIDDFLVSDVLSECVSECGIINNYLYSNHVPLTTFDIDYDHAKTTKLTFREKKSSMV